jgi:Tetratricopeptide repeat
VVFDSRDPASPHDPSVPAFRDFVVVDIEGAVGAAHPSTLIARVNMASTMLQAGDINESIAEFRRILVDITVALGPNHPSTLDTRFNLATALARGGDEAAALEMFRALLDDQVRMLGPDDPKTQNTKTNANADRFWGRSRRISLVTMKRPAPGDRQSLLG